MRRGRRTSEFWLTLGSFGVSAFLVVYGAISHDRELLMMGMGAAAFSGGTYSISRGVAKAGKGEES